MSTTIAHASRTLSGSTTEVLAPICVFVVTRLRAERIGILPRRRRAKRRETTQNLPAGQPPALRELHCLTTSAQKLQENRLASSLHQMRAWIQPISIASWRAQPIRA